MLYAFFSVITRRLDFIWRRFGTLRLFHLHRQVDVSRILMLLRAKPLPVPFLIPSSFYSPLPACEDGTDGVFRNVGI